MTLSPSEADFKWPQNLGRVTHRAIFDSPYHVFKLEDAFYEMSTQESAVQILRYLCDNYGVRLICMEGTSNAISVAHIKPVLKPEDEPRLKQAMLDREMGVAVYLALATDLPLLLYGVEHQQRYEKNKEAMFQVIASESLVTKTLAVLEHRSNEQRKARYSPRALAFVDAVKRYDDNEMPLGSFMRYLLDLAVEQRLDTEPFVNTRRFCECLEMENAFANETPVRQDTAALLTDIVRCLEQAEAGSDVFRRAVRASARQGLHQGAKWPQAATPRAIYQAFVQQEMNALAAMGQSIQKGERPSWEIYTRITEVAILCDLDLRRYPALMQYSHYLHRVAALQTNKLFEERTRLLSIMSEATLATTEERQIAATERLLHGVQRMCKLQASPREADEVLSEFGQLTAAELLARVRTNLQPTDEIEAWSAAADVLAREREQRGLSSKEMLEHVARGAEAGTVAMKEVAALDASLEGAYRFYQLAPTRARNIAANTLRYMREHDVTAAALVSGGFLTSQIVRVLEREAVSCTVILPNADKGGVTREQHFAGFDRRSTFLGELQARANAQRRSQPSDAR